MPGWGYPSLKVVIQYMEANKRISLVRRCPDLENVDKTTPLQLNYLFLSVEAVGINSTTYELGMIRHFPKDAGKIPKQFQIDNAKSGVRYDLNLYGKVDLSFDKVVNPGEIVLEPSDPIWGPLIERTDEEEDIYLGGLQTRFATLKAQRRMKERQREMERIEGLLYAWELRKQGASPPYTKYLQYTKTGGKKEYLEYNKKLYEAARYLMHLLFAGRKCPMKVCRLQLTKLGGVLRLPETVRFHALSLQIGSNVGSVIKSLGDVLVKKGNYQTIDIIGGPATAVDYNLPIIKSAREFGFHYATVTGVAFENLMRNARNPRLFLMNGKSTKQEYFHLIDTIIREKKTIGSTYSFGINSESIVAEIFEEIKVRVGVFTEPKWKRCLRFPIVYSLPIDHSSKLEIYCDRNKDYDDNDNGEMEPWTLWFYVRRVFPVAVKA